MSQRRLAIYRADMPDETLYEGPWPEVDDVETVAARLGREHAWGQGAYLVALLINGEPRAWRRVIVDLPSPPPDPWRPIELAVQLARLPQGRS